MSASEGTAEATRADGDFGLWPHRLARRVHWVTRVRPLLTINQPPPQTTTKKTTRGYQRNQWKQETQEEG